jgi:hypothetical protein
MAAAAAAVARTTVQATSVLEARSRPGSCSGRNWLGVLPVGPRWLRGGSMHLLSSSASSGSSVRRREGGKAAAALVARAPLPGGGSGGRSVSKGKPRVGVLRQRARQRQQRGVLLSAVETQGAAEVSGSWDEEDENDEETEVEKGKFMSWVGRWWDWKKGGDGDEATTQAAADDAELLTVGIDERVESAEGEVSELGGQQGEKGEQLGLMLKEQESGAFSLPAHRKSLTACTN